MRTSIRSTDRSVIDLFVARFSPTTTPETPTKPATEPKTPAAPTRPAPDPIPRTTPRPNGPPPPGHCPIKR